MSEYKKRALKENEMSWYVSLWKTNNFESREKMLKMIKVDGDISDFVVSDVMRCEPIYESYEEFLESFEHRY